MGHNFAVEIPCHVILTSSFIQRMCALRQNQQDLAHKCTPQSVYSHAVDSEPIEDEQSSIRLCIRAMRARRLSSAAVCILLADSNLPRRAMTPLRVPWCDPVVFRTEAMLT